MTLGKYCVVDIPDAGRIEYQIDGHGRRIGKTVNRVLWSSDAMAGVVGFGMVLRQTLGPWLDYGTRPQWGECGAEAAVYTAYVAVFGVWKWRVKKGSGRHHKRRFRSS